MSFSDNNTRVTWWKGELLKLLKCKEAGVKESVRECALPTETTGDYSTLICHEPPPRLHPSLSPVDEPSISQVLVLCGQQYQSHTDSMCLLPADPINFNWGPLKYWQFIRLFSTIVDKEIVPDEEKLMRLHQYTIRSAREAIAHCSYNPDPEEDFADAMSTLKKPTHTQSHRPGLIRSRSTMRSNITSNCRALLTLFAAVATLWKPWRVRTNWIAGCTLLWIIEKLPDDLKKKCLNENYKITESGRLPKVDDVLNLVEAEAPKRADPIFGSLLSRNAPASTDPDSNKSGSNKSIKKQTSAAESTSESKPALTSGLKVISKYKCPKCTGGQFLNQCGSFRGLSVQEHLKFVWQNKLCHNSFMQGHTKDACTHSRVCKVPGCGQKHNSCLHSATASTTINDNNNNQSTESTNQAAVRGRTTNQPPALKAHVIM